MKMLLILVLAVATSNAFAMDIKRIKSKIFAGTTSSSSAMAPTRNAQARYKIMRMNFVQKPDGSYERKTTDICKGLTPVPVYDYRGLEIDIQGSSKVTCVDSAESKTIVLTNVIVIANDEVIDQREDIKFVWSFLEVGPKGGATPSPSTLEQSADAFAGTKDLNAKSFLQSVFPTILDLNPSTSFYTAIVDIQD